MLFNSQFFVFIFLPLSLGIYVALSSLSRDWGLRSIIVASLIFYAWWRPSNVFIIVPAMLLNYGAGRMILDYVGRGELRPARIVLILGIVFNIAFLGYFKYTNFALLAFNDLLGSNLPMRDIILPLGISFITFQNIAFLIDVHGGGIKSFRLQDYCSFILFFPQLVAGPIVHYREMMPQFHDSPRGWNSENLAVGTTLFLFGLFKKVVIADGMAPLVSSLYAISEGGTPVSLLPAWLAAVGFTLQIYFDFSGYTDMALGAARLFGIRLPLNFNSPLRASSIIDFWLRWHVSLTRFLTAYVYNPIVLKLTRRRLAAGRAGFGGAGSSPGSFLQLIMMPTILTMLISGIWHGAGYLFVLWGLLHGLYLTINHAWRILAAHVWGGSAAYNRVMKPVGTLLTFVAVVFSMVIFRATDMSSASNILHGMLGWNGIEVPQSLVERLSPLIAGLSDGNLATIPDAYHSLLPLAFWIIVLLPVALACPNTLQLLDRFQPAIGVLASEDPNFLRFRISWRPTVAWVTVIAFVGFFAVSRIGGYSEFLYWQF